MRRLWIASGFVLAAMTPVLLAMGTPSSARRATSAAQRNAATQPNPVVWADAGKPDLTGVYEAVSSGTRLPSGTRTPPVDLTKLSLLPVALAESKQQDLAKDPAKNCQPIGPFRLMARDDNKIELVRTPARMTMLHENVSLGSIREIYLTRQHSTKFEPGWNGESVGRWVADTLVVETIGFNDRTWLNDQGAPHSENLRVIERYRPILGGSYLAVTVTAEDPKVLAAPFTYTRYYKKTTAEIKEHICEY